MIMKQSIYVKGNTKVIAMAMNNVKEIHYSSPRKAVINVFNCTTSTDQGKIFFMFQRSLTKGRTLHLNS